MSYSKGFEFRFSAESEITIDHVTKNTFPYESVCLLAGMHGAEFGISAPEDEDLDGKLRLSLGAHHVKDEATGETYHTRIWMLITRADLENIVKTGSWFLSLNMNDEP